MQDIQSKLRIGSHTNPQRAGRSWKKFRRLRVIGDTTFGIGVVVLGWFVLGIKTARSSAANHV